MDAPTFTTDFARVRQELTSIKTLKAMVNSSFTHLEDENVRLRKENAELRRKLELYEQQYSA